MLSICHTSKLLGLTTPWRLCSNSRVLAVVHRAFMGTSLKCSGCNKPTGMTETKVNIVQLQLKISELKILRNELQGVIPSDCLHFEQFSLTHVYIWTTVIFDFNVYLKHALKCFKSKARLLCFRYWVNILWWYMFCLWVWLFAYFFLVLYIDFNSLFLHLRIYWSQTKSTTAQKSSNESIGTTLLVTSL